MPEPIPDWPSPPFVFVIDGVKTLPLYTVRAKTLEEIPVFGYGKVHIEYCDPEYISEPYGLTPEWLSRIGHQAESAKEMVRLWKNHQGRYHYYIQFRDDVSGLKGKALHGHTALLSALCDSRFTIDTSGLWSSFDAALHLGMVYSEYRADALRDERYERYAERVALVYERSRLASLADGRLLGRIAQQIELKAAIWTTLPPIRHVARAKVEGRKIRLFYCYSHRDERLRNRLESHLAVLKRNGLIESWHDRKIGAGNEWKNSIDTNLEAADVILLLVSADFLNSEYCYDVEMKRALERHEQGSAKVIPVILRACDWTASPFGKLQALPTDAKPVTSWTNRDEAFTDIATGLGDRIRQMVNQS